MRISPSVAAPGGMEAVCVVPVAVVAPAAVDAAVPLVAVPLPVAAVPVSLPSWPVLRVPGAPWWRQ